MPREWQVAPIWPEREVAARDWKVTPLVAQVLYNRQITTSEQSQNFLFPKLIDLYEPHTLPGAESAADRIVHAIKNQEKIVVYGDYDVDGITGVAILWHLFILSSASVDLYIPHRLEEGYGLNSTALQKLASEGARLVITVDCGISAVEAAETAVNLGLDLIITDHHTPHDRLPPCRQIVHPTAIGMSPNPHLCGSGVAFKLAWAVAQKLSAHTRVDAKFREFLLNATSLAALGTVADIVPLMGENRVIARFGLAGLSQSSLCGLKALIESAGLTGEKIDSYGVGFKLAPRLNAAGRMGHARLALELLTRADQARSREIAAYLEDQNRSRQSLEKKIFTQAKEMVLHQQLHLDHSRAIVLAHEDWHVGVIGIVASRLVDEFHRPAVMISLSNGTGQGSARSVHHFELNQALEACREHLMAYGGHQMAAGLKIESQRINGFRDAFIQYANNRLTAADLIPKLSLDAEVSLSELGEPTVQTLTNLGPFGPGNPRPRLASPWLDLEGEPRCVGKSGDHLQFTVRENRITRKAIAFGQGKQFQALRDRRRCRLAFEPIINEFRGYRSVELQVMDIQLHEVPDFPS